MSQENEDDSTSEIQITNVCSLSSVLNMYLPHDEKVVKALPTRGNKTNSLTSYGTPNTINKNNPLSNKKTLPIQFQEQPSTKYAPVKKHNSVKPASSSSSANPPLSNGSTPKTKPKLNQVPKTSESVVLKITNLNSKTPCVSSVTPSSSKTSIPQEPIPTIGRIKVKSFKDLMAKPADDFTIRENVTSVPVAEKTNNEHVSDNNLSELKISSPFSIHEDNEEKKSRHRNQENMSGDEKDIVVANTPKVTSDNNSAIKNKAEDESIAIKDSFDNKNNKTSSEINNISELLKNELTEHDVKLKKEEPSTTFKEEGDESFDKDDCYVCMDCEPLKLLNGLGLTQHCINNPTHFQINHLADFNKFDIALQKLSKSRLNRSFDCLANDKRPIVERSIIFSSQSSIDSGSSDCLSDNSSLRRKRKRRKLENRRYFESSDTATDDDLTQDRLSNRKRHLIKNKRQ